MTNTPDERVTLSGALYYPPANRTAQWFGPASATVAPNKVLWHTTETAGGWPGYASGASAPNLTYEPWQHLWRQHFPLNGTARALKNGSDGWQTNRKSVCQVEVSCYCDPARFGTGKGIDRLDDQAYDDMSAFAEFMRAEWGVPLRTTVVFKPYPKSYGFNGVRLSRAQFVAYRGHLDHMHAPDNTHGDAGLMDVPRIVRTPQPQPEDDDMAGPIIKKGASVFGLITGDRWINLSEADAVKLRDQAGIKIVTGLSPEGIVALQTNLVSEAPPPVADVP